MSPERFNSDLYLTTSQVAELFDVHPSTVKRWCNDGELAFDKTGGGHRRIHLTDALALAGERNISTFLAPFSPYEGHVWTAVSEVVDTGSYARVHALAMGWLLRGKIGRLSQLFLELGRHPQIPFHDFCDNGISGFMRDVGEAWRSGQLRVAEEHMLSETLQEVLVQLRPEMRRLGEESRRGLGPQPVAVVGSMEGDRHSFGSFCIRLALERRGWRVYYLGADVPVEDFAAMQKARGASLVGVSFAPPGTGADMKRCIRILAEFYDPAHPFALALGGQATDSVDLSDVAPPFADLGAFSSVTSFNRALEEGFATSPAGAQEMVGGIA
jgi:excisionase family DNA binding protein